MRTNYDFIFSIGSACSCTQVLRAAGLQHASFPFDWITIRDRPADIRFRADLIAGDFRDWFAKDAFVFLPSPTWHLKDFYRNTKLGITFNHDFPKGVPFEESYPVAKARYDRRIERLCRCIRASQRVLVVRLDRPDQEYPTTIDDCRYARQRLAEKFPGVHFDVVLLSCEPGLAFDNRCDRSEDGIRHIVFDYKSRASDAQTYTPDMPRLIRLFADLYSVRDYRTRAERAAEARRRTLARYARYDARSWPSYQLHRFCRHVSDAVRSWDLARLQARARKFDHIIPLGVNCEVAFRFFCSWRFVESSLFAWSRVEGLDHLCEVLSGLDGLFAGEAILEPRSRMWQCQNTRVYLHGRFRAGKPGSPPPLEPAQRADLEDLRGRVGHLREKFRKYFADDKTTLFVHRLDQKDAESPLLAERLDRLEAALSALGAKNWTLLVVCESKDLSRMPAGQNRVFRAVRQFNPGNRVTDEDSGDRVGWKRIFAEFGPAEILEQRHRFKFE